jgi:hypothetical protein
LSISWFENQFHRLIIRTIDGRLVIEHEGPLGVSEWLHDWLLATPGVDDIKWYTQEAWQRGGLWQNRPW